MSKLLLKFAFLFLVAGCASSKKVKFDDYVFQSKKEKTTYIKSYNRSLKLWGIPYSQENIKTRFGTAHIVLAGPKNGKKLVLLHGMDASSTMWYPNIKALAKTHRIYAIDFLEEPGKSTLTSKSLSADDIVIWYNDIFNYYKLKQFDIIGASRGGWIATLLATQKNNSINKMILLSPAQTFEFVDKIGKTTTALFLKLFPSQKKFDKTMEIFSTHPENISPVYNKQFYLANKYAKSNTGMLKMQPFSDDDLKLITHPVLVLIGDHDVINSEKSLVKVQNILVKGQSKIIKDAGHFLSIDQSKAVNEDMVTFLK
ncbi:alpha/beta fold hydrolase [Flavobacterium sp. PL002]|uniref:alpha/beta fold hydrolase n=1 Tax=Flavobacterium sp. PL002 TaxID=1897058 RepID=UPI001787D19F|nr:alpha/beta hydrolase [Flavobacterium sp. PL002]MBE0393717.1 Carboxylesterase YbfK [Flavobacterium sp. PL002]